MHTPYTFTFILVLLLGVIFYNFRCLPFEKKLELNMGDDYTWVCAKQNERFRSHDFGLKLWIGQKCESEKKKKKLKASNIPHISSLSGDR